MFVATGTYPVRAGNRIRPLVDGIPTFSRIREAVDSAERRVWVTVCFVWESFRLPDGSTFFELLGRAVDRGVDVRVLAWRPDGRAENVLEEAPPRVPTRLDRAYPGFAQHQKTWLVDETGFVGGMNLNPHTMVEPGHRGQEHYHDVYLELVGPCTADLAHNFVQRWNEASGRDADDLPFSDAVPEPAGPSVVQLQRTIHPGRYRDLPDGERSIFDQYRAAIAGARRSIYVENQFLEDPRLVADLHSALERGVEVVAVLPGEPAPSRHGRDFLDARAALGDHESFTLAGIAGVGDDGERQHVYVHSKLMLVDDTFAIVGTANLHAGGLYGSAELNAAMQDPEAVRALRCQLFAEHLGESTDALDDTAALRRFGEVARDNRRRWAAGDHSWPGLAFSLDPRAYGR